MISSIIELFYLQDCQVSRWREAEFLWAPWREMLAGKLLVKTINGKETLHLQYFPHLPGGP